MLCEICGENNVKIYKVRFEGSLVLACLRCVKKYDLKLVRKPVTEPRYMRPSKKLFGDSTLVEGYGSMIKRAREGKGLSQAELAKLVGEKVSIIRKVESEKLMPPDDLIKKLQSVLRIKLVEEGN